MNGPTWKRAFCNSQFQMSTQWPAINWKPKVGKNNSAKTQRKHTGTWMTSFYCVVDFGLCRLTTHARGWWVVGRPARWRHRGPARGQLEPAITVNLPWTTDSRFAAGNVIRRVSVARLYFTSQLIMEKIASVFKESKDQYKIFSVMNTASKL